MFFHALGNFNLHFPLRRSLFLPLRQSITHSLNVLPCPWQFQLTFPAPVVIRTFLECCLMPSVVSIYISAPAVIRTVPERRLTPLAISPAPAVEHTFPECPFMPLEVSIYISRSGGHSHIP